MNYDYNCKTPDCKGTTPFSHRLCVVCWEDRQRARWEALPVVSTWDMLYSETKDQYYDDVDYAIDDLAYDDNLDVDDLRLVVCEPLKPKEFSLSDWVEGYTHPDWEMDTEDQAIEDQINALLATIQDLGWEPGRARPDTTAIQKAIDAERAVAAASAEAKARREALD